MRSFTRILAAILAGLGQLTWQLVNGSWRLVRSLVPSPPQVAESEIPVSGAQAVADTILAASGEARERKPGRDGAEHRYPVGVAAGMAARGYPEYLADLPDDVAVWVASLTGDEQAVLARLPPDRIEAHLSGSLIPSLPALAAEPQPQPAPSREDPAGEPEAEALVAGVAPRFA